MSWLRLLTQATVLVALVSWPLAAEDRVVVRGRRPEERVQKRGEIVDWIAGQLRLRGALDREESIPSERILEVDSSWSEAEQTARRLQREQKLDEAITAFYAAKAEESRPWAARRISAYLSVALLESGQAHLAGDEFLTISTVDPATHLFDAIPLAWRNGRVDGLTLAKARGWLGQDSATARLLGASWLLSTELQPQAIAELERLRTNADRRIAAAAEIQLWRTRIVTVKPDEIARWQSAAGKVPSELRGVAWFQIGEALARQGQAEEAALAYLQTALRYGRQRAMAADALVAAAGQLEKLKRTDEATGLYREVVRDYPATSAAEAARGRLAKP